MLLRPSAGQLARAQHTKILDITKKKFRRNTNSPRINSETCARVTRRFRNLSTCPRVTSSPIERTYRYRGELRSNFNCSMDITSESSSPRATAIAKTKVNAVRQRSVGCDNRGGSGVGGREGDKLTESITFAIFWQATRNQANRF